MIEQARILEQVRAASYATVSPEPVNLEPPCPNCGGELHVDDMTERGHCVGQCHWVFDMEAVAAQGAVAAAVSAPPAPLGQEGVDALSSVDQRSRLKAMLTAWNSDMSVRRQVEAKVRLQTMGQPVSARGYHPAKVFSDEISAGDGSYGIYQSETVDIMGMDGTRQTRVISPPQVMTPAQRVARLLEVLDRYLIGARADKHERQSVVEEILGYLGQPLRRRQSGTRVMVIARYRNDCDEVFRQFLDCDRVHVHDHRSLLGLNNKHVVLHPSARLLPGFKDIVAELQRVAQRPFDVTVQVWTGA